MISPGAAEFCMISFAVISITNCGFDEKMQGFFAIIGRYEKFAHYDGADEKIWSPMVW